LCKGDRHLLPVTANRDVPILLIGYKRADLLVKRLEEIAQIGKCRVFVSLDGIDTLDNESIDQKIIDLRREAVTSYSQRLRLTLWESKTNLGLTKNVTESISRVFETEQELLIIEDDISISWRTYHELQAMLSRDPTDSVEVVCLFTPWTKPNNILKYQLPKNRWRNTRYFSPWGWYVKRDVWMKYSTELPFDYISKLKKSSAWSALPVQHQNVWLGRFKKVADNSIFTWDYQFQYLVFVENIKIISPIYRLVENEGFNDPRSTNTKTKKPWWMRSKLDEQNYDIVGMNYSNFVEVFLRVIEENTIVGTGLIFRLKARIK
jgi:hypothetical protein